MSDKPNVDPSELPEAVGTTIYVGGGPPSTGLGWLAIMALLVVIIHI